MNIKIMLKILWLKLWGQIIVGRLKNKEFINVMIRLKIVITILTIKGKYHCCNI
jgi:hypothetical protein